MDQQFTPEQLALFQNVFDRVWVFLNKQGRPAKDDGACVYLAPNGDMCAVGCLLDRSKITENIEEISVSGFLLVKDISLEDAPHYEKDLVTKAGHFKKALEDSGLDTNNESLFQLLAMLQRAHDDASSSDWLYSWRHRMDSIVKTFSLIPRPTDYVLPT